MYAEHTKLSHDLKESIYDEMMICSYDLNCSDYGFDFVELKDAELYRLQESSKELYSLFHIPKNDTYALKISLSRETYEKRESVMINQLFWYAVGAFFIIFLISIFFSLYALYPLRKALNLTQEFSRDILHDLNTPLSAIRLNINMMTPSPKDNKKIERINNSLETIISLGNNLRSYLEEHEYQIQQIDVKAVIEELIALNSKLYPSLEYKVKGQSFHVNTNLDAIKRIFDNLLSNASKYNKENGEIIVEINALNTTVKIQDTGKGIIQPQKIFERFYKEQERGVGIGMHIVKKLCDEMKIKIELQSVISQGTTIILDFQSLTQD